MVTNSSRPMMNPRRGIAIVRDMKLRELEGNTEGLEDVPMGCESSESVDENVRGNFTGFWWRQKSGQ